MAILHVKATPEQARQMDRIIVWYMAHDIRGAGIPTSDLARIRQLLLDRDYDPRDVNSLCMRAIIEARRPQRASV